MSTGTTGHCRGRSLQRGLFHHRRFLESHATIVTSAIEGIRQERHAGSSYIHGKDANTMNMMGSCSFYGCRGVVVAAAALLLLAPLQPLAVQADCIYSNQTLNDVIAGSDGRSIPTPGSCCMQDVCGLACPLPVPPPGPGTCVPTSLVGPVMLYVVSRGFAAEQLNKVTLALN